MAAATSPSGGVPAAVATTAVTADAVPSKAVEKPASEEGGTLTVDDLEEVQLELNRFAERKGREEPPAIPALLEGYLRLVASAGSTFFPWAKVKGLFRAKLERVIDDFFEASPLDDVPPAPNVDGFEFRSVKDKVFEQLDAFAGIPFTVQRLAELLTAPRRHYKRTDKFMRALEKNVLVVSSVEPRSQNPPPPPQLPATAAPSTPTPAAPDALTNGDHSPSSTERPVDGADEHPGADASKGADPEAEEEEPAASTAAPSSAEEGQVDAESPVPVSSSEGSTAEPVKEEESAVEAPAHRDSPSQEASAEDESDAEAGPCDSAETKTEPEKPVEVEDNEAHSVEEKSDPAPEPASEDTAKEPESAAEVEKVEEMEVDAECSSSDTKIQQISQEEGEKKPQ